MSLRGLLAWRVDLLNVFKIEPINEEIKMLYNPYNLLGVLIFVFDVFAIVSVIAGRSSTERKILWTLLILFLPLVGMILYYVVGRNRQDAIASPS
jgi:hypothetical protein